MFTILEGNLPFKHNLKQISNYMRCWEKVSTTFGEYGVPNILVCPNKIASGFCILIYFKNNWGLYPSLRIK